MRTTSTVQAKVNNGLKNIWLGKNRIIILFCPCSRTGIAVFSNQTFSKQLVTTFSPPEAQFLDTTIANMAVSPQM